VRGPFVIVIVIDPSPTALSRLKSSALDRLTHDTTPPWHRRPTADYDYEVRGMRVAKSEIRPFRPFSRVHRGEGSHCHWERWRLAGLWVASGMLRERSRQEAGRDASAPRGDLSVLAVGGHTLKGGQRTARPTSRLSAEGSQVCCPSFRMLGLCPFGLRSSESVICGRSFVLGALASRRQLGCKWHVARKKPEGCRRGRQRSQGGGVNVLRLVVR